MRFSTQSADLQGRIPRELVKGDFLFCNSILVTVNWQISKLKTPLGIDNNQYNSFEKT